VTDHHVAVFDAAHVRLGDIDVNVREQASLPTITASERNSAASECGRILERADDIPRIA